MDGDIAARVLLEIDELHACFQDWMGQAGPAPAHGATGGIDRLEASLAADFAMVTPSGTLVSRGPLVAQLVAARGCHADPKTPFRIAIEEAEAIPVSDGIVLARYIERQWSRSGETARRSTAMFRASASGPRGVQWVTLHEIWIA